MYVRHYEVKSAKLILDESEESSRLFDECTGRLRRTLYGLPDGGTLILDLKRVIVAAEPFLFDMIVMLRSMNEGLLKNKHLILANLKPRVLQSLINVLDKTNECAMLLDHNYRIKPVGSAFNSSFLKTLHAVFRADKNNETVSPQNINDYEKNISPQVAAECLRRLFNWGFIQKRERPGSRGRPFVSYYPFWPASEKYVPSDEVCWELPLPDDSSKQESYCYPGVNEISPAV